jgi:hypothetical protein
MTGHILIDDAGSLQRTTPTSFVSTVPLYYFLEHDQSGEKYDFWG